MRSYIKIYGPPVVDAIKALENIAVSMPTVCIWDTFIEREVSGISDYAGRSRGGIGVSDWASKYFAPTSIGKERCNNIISGSGEMLGEYDFFFEWFTSPTMNQIEELIKKIDGALTKLGCLYTIVTK